MFNSGVLLLALEIIAELAQGFEGRPEQARLLMKAGAAAGADAVKYQLVYADELATPDYKHFDLFKTLEMTDEEWESLGRYAQELGIKLYLDVFGPRSLALTERLGLSAVKLHGTDVANIGFLEQVAASSIPKVLLGAGGAYRSEIEGAIEILAEKDVVVLLGFQGYPTPNETNQISRIRLLADRSTRTGNRVAVGFADHAEPRSSLSHALATTAIGSGAEVIEKHLTLGRIMKLEDHESAINPDEFAEFCDTIRSCTEAFGEADSTEDFGMSEAELNYRKQIRRHVVASRDIPSGSRLSSADLVLKRASADDVITDLNLVYGSVVKRDIAANTPLSMRDIEPRSC